MGTPFFRRVSEDNTILFLGNKVSVLASGEDTEGRYATTLNEERRGFEPPPHTHKREDETFYVLEGQITYYIGDSVIHAVPGTYVFAPKGIKHTFKVNTETAKVLLSVYPAGFEQFVYEVSEPAPQQLPPAPESPPSPEEIHALTTIAAKYGIVME
jgi:quercetin dioxygenase-like cupin family protein